MRVIFRVFENYYGSARI